MKRLFSSTLSGRIAKFAFSLLAILLLNACVVQSFYYFCPKEKRISCQKINGEWDIVFEKGKDTDSKKDRCWIFKDKDISSVDNAGRRADLDVVYFRIGDDLFADIGAGEIPQGKAREPVNEYWLQCVSPMRTLCKVKIKDDTLLLIPISYEYLSGLIEAGKPAPSHLTRGADAEKKGFIIFTASEEEWFKFLEKEKAEADLFKEEHALKFNRAKTEKQDVK